MSFPTYNPTFIRFDKSVLHGVAQVLDGGGRLEEFTFDGFSICGISFDDASDFGIPCAIEECVYEGLRLIAFGQSRCLLVHGVDVSVEDGMGVLPAVIR